MSSCPPCPRCNILNSVCCCFCGPEDVENQVLCKYTLKDDDLTKLRDAIEDLYYFEFVIGNQVCFRV